MVLVVDPAGTGKTTAMRPAVEQSQVDGQVVFGVAPSAIAAGVLSAETGVVADTIDKLLTEHRSGRPHPRFDLPVGSTVIVDEAGMLGTAKLANLIRLAEDRVWRVALVGDPLLFFSVGQGGMFGMLVDTHGGIELDHVHRFTIDGEDAATDVFACYITNDWIDLPAHRRAQELWAPTGQEPDWPTRVITHEDDFGNDL